MNEATVTVRRCSACDAELLGHWYVATPDQRPLCQVCSSAIPMEPSQMDRIEAKLDGLITALKARGSL